MGFCRNKYRTQKTCCHKLVTTCIVPGRVWVRYFAVMPKKNKMKLKKKTQQQYSKNRAERIRSANLKGTKIKNETLKKYNITFNSNTGNYE